MINDVLRLSIFELEYQQHAKLNPFSEKWTNCNRTRTRIRGLRLYLYRQIRIILSTSYGEQFYNTAIRLFDTHQFPEFSASINRNFERFPEPNEEVSDFKHDLLYRLLYFTLTLDELFILFTNLITWEHQTYPVLLEAAIATRYFQKVPLQLGDDCLRYYVRFLDVLSSSEINSLFDLDALRTTIRLDTETIGEKPLSGLLLFQDWPLLNTEPFHRRFPQFKTNLERKIELIS